VSNSAAQPNTPVYTESFVRDIQEHFDAGYQILYVPSVEEARVERHIDIVGDQIGIPVITWDCARGFTREGEPFKPLSDPKYRDVMAALDVICSDNGAIPPMNYRGESVPDNRGSKNCSAIFVFRDTDDFTNNPFVRRRLKNIFEGKLLSNCQLDFQRMLIIVSAVTDVHNKLRSTVTLLDFAMPDELQLLQTVRIIEQSSNAQAPPITEEFAQQIAVSLLGLTEAEAENCLSRCVVRDQGFSPTMLKMIKEEKSAIVKRSEILTYIPEDSVHARSDIGGYDAYLAWLDERKQSYSADAKKLNIDPPRGVVIAGIPGTGKSMIAKATCRALDLPGYVLDIGSLFGSKVGESEQRTREVLKQIDAQKGCVLVIDEADKALGNAHESQGDSGVTRRVFGQLLTWLAESKSRTFVIVTLNRTNGLPPEFFRAGRFDQMWFVDLPNEVERRQIFNIHMRLRGTDPATLPLTEDDWSALIKQTNEYVGAEIEEVVRNARYASFANQRNGAPTFEQLTKAVNDVIPMSRRNADELKAIREFCAEYAKNVTTPLQYNAQAARKSRSVNIKTN